jgi:hypothetical protein
MLIMVETSVANGAAQGSEPQAVEPSWYFGQATPVNQLMAIPGSAIASGTSAALPPLPFFIQTILHSFTLFLNTF